MVGNIGILYEDPYILVCRKPAGVPVQSANARVKDMVSILKLYLLEESGKPGEPYLGVVHRLDQPVQGVIVFAKTKQAAANLSSQIADRKGSGQVVKRYCAVVRRNADVYKETETAAEYQELTDYLQRDRRTNTSYIVPKGTKGAKESKLRYAILEETEDLSLVDIELLTGIIRSVYSFPERACRLRVIKNTTKNSQKRQEHAKKKLRHSVLTA